MVKTHAEMKRRLQAKEKFIMVSSIHEGFEGQIRTPSHVGKSYIYSIIEDEPYSRVSQMNGGKGCYMQFGKASDWRIENGICACLAHDSKEVLFSFRFMSDAEEFLEKAVQDTIDQMTFEELVEFVEGRTITVERMNIGEYAISAETHDAYVYSAKTVEEAVKKYEQDRKCIVGKVYEYGSGNLIFDKSEWV